MTPHRGGRTARQHPIWVTDDTSKGDKGIGLVTRNGGSIAR